MIDVAPPYALDKAGLLGAVAAALRCRSVRRKEWRGSAYGYVVHLFGFPADLDRTELLYTSLLVQASYGLAAAEVPPWEAPAAFRRSWLVGFTQAVGARLRAAERHAEEEAARRTGPGGSGGSGTSVALVLADRSAQVDRRVAEAYPRLGTAPPRRLLGSGRAGGYAAGQRADLGAVRLRTTTARGITGQ